MALPARLLRPIVSGDADARAYIEAVQRADGDTLEPGVRKAITDFIVGCKQDGIWGAIKACCILMGARTLSGALVPLVGAAPTNNNFVSGDYNRKTGLVGNASTKSLASNRLNNADGQNDHHMAVYASTAGAATSYYISSSPQNVSGASGFGTFVGNTFYRSRNVTLTSTTGIQFGFIGVSRASSSNYDRRISGTTSNVSQASSAPTSNQVLLFTEGTTSFSSARIAFYSIGASVTLSLLDTRVSDLYTAIGNAVP